MSGKTNKSIYPGIFSLSIFLMLFFFDVFDASLQLTEVSRAVDALKRSKNRELSVCQFMHEASCIANRGNSFLFLKFLKSFPKKPTWLSENLLGKRSEARVRLFVDWLINYEFSDPHDCIIFFIARRLWDKRGKHGTSLIYELEHRIRIDYPLFRADELGEKITKFTIEPIKEVPELEENKGCCCPFRRIFFCCKNERKVGPKS